MEGAARPQLTIRPPSRWAPLNLQELWEFRGLLLSLAARDIKLRYRQTVLGALWVLLQPVFGAGVFALVFGGIAGLPSDGVPYFLFAFAGLLAWSAFQSTLTRASSCLVQNSQLISKVFFPRMVLPLSTVLSTLLDFAVGLALMGALLVGFRVAPGPGLVLLPVWLGLVLLLAVGLGLFASAWMVSYRDVQHVLPILVQFVMYASPVAYAVSVVPETLRPVFILNPLSGLLEAFRWSLLGQARLDWGSVGYSAVVACAVFVRGAYEFRRMEQRFADVI